MTADVRMSDDTRDIEAVRAWARGTLKMLDDAEPADQDQLRALWAVRGWMCAALTETDAEVRKLIARGR